MTKVAILPEPTEGGDFAYRAIAGGRQSVGKTAGEALDALTALLPVDQTGTLVIVQNLRPDVFFAAEQQNCKNSWHVGGAPATAANRCPPTSKPSWMPLLMQKFRQPRLAPPRKQPCRSAGE